ncbi:MULTISPECIES: hypothetical protein [Streptomyces]|uniref:WXG100 family type VII secretion target n=2 Tax=Streptomyces violaceusniger group TaxID=2839105 RepID=A0ABD5JN73_9ACTN|nr:MULTISPECIES: hypothetical protein [Streptomyces]MEE4588579.1 hypothetical protein [Streptomyces sp. DSM 41602]RSS42998.1 hypothetical protein EF902_19380 [Streptomyces sp. WAC05858]WTA84406.1 hypothetical protein OG751_33530 [Streptomyces antimycoticus]
MVNQGELKITKEAEEQITRSLRSALKGLEGAGNCKGSAQGGSLGNMHLSATEASGNGLASTFSDFCEFWQLGINMLESTANSLGSQLSQAAGVLWEEDRNRAGALRAALGAARGAAGVGAGGILGSFGGPSGTSDYTTQPYPQSGPGIDSGDDIKTVKSSILDYITTDGKGAGRNAGQGNADGGGN